MLAVAAGFALVYFLSGFLERNRVAGLFRAHLSQTGGRPSNGRAPLSLN